MEDKGSDGKVCEGFITITLNTGVVVKTVDNPNSDTERRRFEPYLFGTEAPTVRGHFPTDQMDSKEKAAAALVTALNMLKRAEESLMEEAERLGFKVREPKDSDVEPQINTAGALA